MSASPDFAFGPLQINVHGYQFPAAEDYWNPDWLMIDATVDMPGQAWVRASESFLMTSGLSGLRNELQIPYDKRDGEAGLWTLEPELKVRLEGKATGSPSGEIDLTPDQTSHEHNVYLELDQSDLPQAIEQLILIVNRWPVRGHAK